MMAKYKRKDLCLKIVDHDDKWKINVGSKEFRFNNKLFQIKSEFNQFLDFF